MGKTYRAYDPDQQFLMPPSLQDWLPEGHLVYFISDLVDGMDLAEIEGFYEG
jgi:transposase